ncbi:FAD-dependent monooxygenase [Nocardia sp. NPDC005978]|uniref:FAD-dependent oxidoreductase n=1 Tax=Nocardia sp. NPDC005978 TaxID=3156725 RepID=UPI0033A5D858
MRIGVLGAGIAGLVFAKGLESSGHKICLYDAATRLRPIGAGVTLGPRSLGLLDAFGVEGRIREIGCAIGSAIVTDQHDTVLYEGEWPQPRMGALGGVSILRADLQDVLVRSIENLNPRLGKKALDCEVFDDCAVVGFGDGSRESFDLVVSADGINSMTASTINPSQYGMDHGTMAYRALIPLARVIDELGAEPVVRLWVGERKNFLCYPVQGGNTVYATAYVEKAELDATSPAQVRARIAAEFEGWARPVAAMIGAMDEISLRPITFRSPPERLYRKRIVGIGDAVHAICSHSAQGANLAVESAVHLARALSGVDGETVGTALREYEATHLDRVRYLHEYALGVADHYHDPFGSDIASKVGALRARISSSQLTRTREASGV